MNSDCISLSVGELIKLEPNDYDEVYGKAYRVEIYLEEIYKHMIITELQYFGEGGIIDNGEKKIQLDDGLNVDSERTGNIEFDKWENGRQFILKA